MELSGVARQLAAVGPGLSFGDRRATHGAHWTAAPRAIRAEARLLRTQFGDEYGTYCTRTSRLVPGLC